MQLRYDDETKARLRHWRDTDPLLYQATSAQLEAIKADPDSHGIKGSPFVPRLVAFSVNGRDEEYVITWQLPQDDVTIIVNISTVEEMQQRARMGR